MSKKHLLINMLITLVLTACETGSDPSQTQSGLKSASDCPQNITVKIDGKALPVVTIPNPFHGFPNPGLRIQEGSFIVELNTKEIGFFELLNFNATQLQSGTFEGDQFQLRLSYSPYSNTSCAQVSDPKKSKLIIEEYQANADKKFSGCFYGILDCDGKLVEVKTPILGTVF